MIEAWASYAVTAGATITAAAAVGTLNAAREVRDQVRNNTEKSEEHRRWLIGEPDLLDGPIVPRIRSVEDQLEDGN